LESDQHVKHLGLEAFSLLRTGLDLRAEFSSHEDLRRYRETYVLHVLDYVLRDRERVHANDLKLFAEQNKDMITLDNVFELANAGGAD
jgi:hypothetical protein